MDQSVTRVTALEPGVRFVFDDGSEPETPPESVPVGETRLLGERSRVSIGVNGRAHLALHSTAHDQPAFQGKLGTHVAVTSMATSPLLEADLLANTGFEHPFFPDQRGAMLIVESAISRYVVPSATELRLMVLVLARLSASAIARPAPADDVDFAVRFECTPLAEASHAEVADIVRAPIGAEPTVVWVAVLAGEVEVKPRFDPDAAEEESVLLQSGDLAVANQAGEVLLRAPKPIEEIETWYESAVEGNHDCPNVALSISEG